MTNAADLVTHGLMGSTLAGELVIDAHMHLGKYYNFLVPRPSHVDLLASATRIGIQRIYGSSLLAIRGDAIAGNSEAIALHDTYPSVFFPYLVYKPNFPEDAAETLELAVTRNIRQFKIHDDGNNVQYDDERYFPLYDHANRNSAAILVHTYGAKHVRPMMKVAAQFPMIRILLAHSGITEEPVYAEAVSSHDNIFLETCNSFAWYGLIERLVKMAGADRVIFGTDMPFMSPEQQIGRILFAKISDDDKRKILGLNAQRIFA